MSEQLDHQRRIFYYAAPEDLAWVDVVDRAFGNLKQQCRLTRGSLEEFSLVEEMTPEKQVVALERLKRQRRLMYGSSAELSREALREERERFVSYEKGVQIVVILVSKRFQKAGLLADPLMIHEMVMRRWRGTGVVASLLLEAVDEQIWPGQIDEVFRRTICPTNSKPLSECENQGQGLHEIALELLQMIADMWTYKSELDNLELRSEEAFQAGQEALRMNPSKKRGTYGHGSILNEWQRFEQALGTYDEILRLDPPFVQIWVSRGKVLAALQRHEEALESYQEALRLDPLHRNAWQCMEETLKALGRKREAREAKRRAN